MSRAPSSTYCSYEQLFFDGDRVPMTFFSQIPRTSKYCREKQFFSLRSCAYYKFSKSCAPQFVYLITPNATHTRNWTWWSDEVCEKKHECRVSNRRSTVVKNDDIFFSVMVQRDFFFSSPKYHRNTVARNEYIYIYIFFRWRSSADWIFLRTMYNSCTIGREDSFSVVVECRLDFF